MAENIIHIATAKSSLPFLTAFIRGILANWLVCLAVVLAATSKSVVGKILGIAIPVTAFVCLGFEHSIANMYFIPMGLWIQSSHFIESSTLSWYAFFVINLIPVTIGNMIGGSLFVGTAHWFLHLSKNN